MIPFGSQIGVLGGGQLGMFFAAAAKRMGYRVSVWDPDPNAPARASADAFFPAPFSDPDVLPEFLRGLAAVTLEWENVPAEFVKQLESKVRVRPSSQGLRTLQNRISEKQFLQEHGLPVTKFAQLEKPRQLVDAVREVGTPCVVKTATAGYDGHGQWRIRKPEEAEGLVETLSGRPATHGWIVEQWVPFEKELSIVIARDDSGEVVTYPVSENQHEEGVLRSSRVPARISDAEARVANEIARRFGEAINSAGVYCIELFALSNARILVNEVAPRPHNTGHYTMDVCSVSQFEQQVRVLCGLPLLVPELRAEAILLNVLGNEVEAIRSPDRRDRLLQLEGLRLYDYQKQEPRSRRKMGHLLIVGDNQTALQEAELILGVSKSSTKGGPGKNKHK